MHSLPSVGPVIRQELYAASAWMGPFQKRVRARNDPIQAYISSNSAAKPAARRFESEQVGRLGFKFVQTRRRGLEFEPPASRKPAKELLEQMNHETDADYDVVLELRSRDRGRVDEV